MSHRQDNEDAKPSAVPNDEEPRPRLALVHRSHAVQRWFRRWGKPIPPRLEAAPAPVTKKPKKRDH